MCYGKRDVDVNRKSYDMIIEELDRRGIQTDEVVYSLCIEDVITVLADKGWLAGLDADQVLELSEFVRAKLEIPWDEYVAELLSSHPIIEVMKKC
jgi:hypothetical protein